AGDRRDPLVAAGAAQVDQIVAAAADDGQVVRAIVAQAVAARPAPDPLETLAVQVDREARGDLLGVQHVACAAGTGEVTRGGGGVVDVDLAMAARAGDQAVGAAAAVEGVLAAAAVDGVFAGDRRDP